MQSIKKWITAFVGSIRSLIGFSAPAVWPWIRSGWKALMGFVDYMRASGIALLKSKAAWAACIAVFVGGLFLGFGLGRAGKAELRRERASAVQARDVAEVRAKSLEAALSEIKAQTKTHQGILEAKDAEIARLRAVGSPPPKVRYITRPASKPPTSAASSKPWNPFQ